LSSKLTDKQEKYVQGLLKGLSQRQAYKAAYNAKNMKDNTIDRKASEILKKDYVKARYDVLRGKVVQMAEDKAIFTVESVLNDLKDIIDKNKGKDDRVALDGIKTAMKHLGMLTDKVEHSGKVDTTVVIEISDDDD